MKRHVVMVLLGELPKLLQSILIEPLSKAKNIKLMQVDQIRAGAGGIVADAVVLSEDSYNALAASLTALPLVVVVSMDGASATAYRADSPPQVFGDFTHSDLLELIEVAPDDGADAQLGFFRRLFGVTTEETRPQPTPMTEADPISKELARLSQLLIKHHGPMLSQQGPGRMLAELSGQLASRARASPPMIPMLDRIRQLFDLTADECNLLSLAALVEVDMRAAKLVGLLNDHMQHTRPRVGLISDLGGTSSDVVARLGPKGPLLRCGLIVIDEDGPMATRMVRAHPDVWPVIFGMPRAAPFRLSAALGDGIGRLVVSDTQRATIIAKGDALAEVKGPVRAVIVGDPDVGRAEIAKVLAAKLVRNVLVVDGKALESAGAAQSLHREAMLNDAAVILSDPASLEPAALCDVLDGTAAPVFMQCTPEEVGAVLRAADRPVIEVAAPRRDLAQRTRIWVAAAPAGLQQDDLRAMAERFDMGHRQVTAAMELAGARAGDGPIAIEDVRSACETLRETRFEGAAERLDCPFDTEDIVLAQDTRAELDLATAWARHGTGLFGCDGPGRALHSGGGMACLFSGPPGVGKTMAAQIIARQVDYTLYRIDLSKIVDKFIGESEKKLAALFDEAERSRVALFFDEADAIFGKRTQVKDSHDRYANITIDYLLQRIEDFDGFAILATNLAGNIDEAFLRRVRVRAEFSAPGPEDRKLIWQRLLPSAEERAADIDVDRLARPFELVGGEIRNAIYTAHLLASQEAQPLAMAHCVKGLWREIKKIGRVTDPGHLGPWRDVIAR